MERCAWLLWASLGFYPLSGTKTFIIGAPLLNVTLLRASTNMSDIIITYDCDPAKAGNSTSVQRILVNGKVRTSPFLYWNGDLLRYDAEGHPKDVNLEFYC